MLKLRALRPDVLTFYIRCSVCGQRVMHSPHTDTFTCACLHTPPEVSSADRQHAASTLQTRRAALLCTVYDL